MRSGVDSSFALVLIAMFVATPTSAEPAGPAWLWLKLCSDAAGRPCTPDEAKVCETRRESPPILHGRVLRECTDADHFMPDTPCWFSSGTARYIGDESGNHRETNYPDWPNVDHEGN